MSELLTVTLTTEEISEVLHVATRYGFWVCNESVQLLCERNDGCRLLFQAAVAGNETTARVCLRHVGVAVAGCSSAQVTHGDLSLGLGLASGVCGGSARVVEVTRSLHVAGASVNSRPYMNSLSDAADAIRTKVAR